MHSRGGGGSGSSENGVEYHNSVVVPCDDFIIRSTYLPSEEATFFSTVAAKLGWIFVLPPTRRAIHSDNPAMKRQASALGRVLLRIWQPRNSVPNEIFIIHFGRWADCVKIFSV